MSPCWVASLRPSGIAPWVALYGLGAAACLAFLPWPYSDDDLLHHIIAREALRDPGLLIDVWGRPGFTIVHALPASLGFLGSRALSALLTLATGLLVAATAGGEGRRVSAAAFAFTVFQPYAFELADGALTETVFAAALALGFWLRARGRPTGAALAWSWAAITRFEGMALLVLFAADFLVAEMRSPARDFRRWLRHVLALGLFPAAWNTAAYAASGFTRPFAIFSENVFLSAPAGLYGSGSWSTFVVWSWAIHGPVVALLAAAGIWRLGRSRDGLVPVVVGGFYAVQSLLWCLGWCRTGGYLRFFAALAPAAALAAAAGIPPVTGWLERRGIRTARVVPAACLFAALWSFAFTALHHVHSDPPYAQVAKAVDLVRGSGGTGSRRELVTSAVLPLAAFDAGRWRPGSRVRKLDPDAVASAPPGTWVLWTGYPGDPEVQVPILDFYAGAERDRVAGLRAAGRPFVHLLEETDPRFEEVADFSLYARSGGRPDDEAWPYFVKLFRVRAAGGGAASR